MFLKPFKSEAQIPVANNGVIMDINITKFQTAADSLLTAGRYVYPQLECGLR